MMVDLVFRAVLILNLTGVFVFGAPLFGVSISDISLTLLAAHVLYLVHRWPMTSRFLATLEMRLWLLLILAWPIATVSYAQTLDVRAVGLQVYYASLFLAAGVFVGAQGWAALRSTVGLAIVITAIGLALSMALPELFAPVVELTDSRGQYGGRAFGFFIQPNVTAENTVFLFVVWFAFGRRHSVVALALAILAMLLMVGVTGSRGGFLAALAATSFVVFDTFRARAKSGRRRYSIGLVAVVATGGTVVILALIAFGVGLVGGVVAETGAEGLVDRIQSVVQGRVGQGLKTDGSVAQRIFSLQQYIDLILQRPLTGYGLGASRYYQSIGRVFIASHNVFVELAFNFGVVYVAYLGSLLLRLVRLSGHRVHELHMDANMYARLISTILIVGMVSNTVFQSRPLIALLGGMVALLAVTAPVVAPGTQEILLLEADESCRR